MHTILEYSTRTVCIYLPLHLREKHIHRPTVILPEQEMDFKRAQATFNKPHPPGEVGRRSRPPARTGDLLYQYHGMSDGND